MQEFRGGYGLRYFFNAGINKDTLVCDEEGTEFYDEDTLEYVGKALGVTPTEIMDMSEYDFEELLYYCEID